MLVTCHKCFCFYCFDPDILGKYSCDKCDKLLYWIFVGDCRSKSVVGWGDGGEWKSKHNMLITLFIKRPTHQCQINASALTGGGKGGFLVCSFAWAGRWMCHLKMAAWCSKINFSPLHPLLIFVLGSLTRHIFKEQSNENIKVLRARLSLHAWPCLFA